MTGVGRRWNILNRLLSLRFGPGAATLPKTVTRIHLEISKFPKVHLGAWKFWRTCIPRLKFHNPAVPMIVNRDPGTDVRAEMTLYLKKPDAVKPGVAAAAAVERQQPHSSATGESKAQPPDWDETIVTVDLQGKKDDEIMLALLEKTGATPVMPNAEEKEAMDRLAKLEEDGKVVSAQDKEDNRKKKEKKMARKAGANALPGRDSSRLQETGPTDQATVGTGAQVPA